MHRYQDPDSPRQVSSCSEACSRPARIQLGRDLWFDQDRYLILRCDGALPLTAREVAVLTKLLDASQRFLSTALLARALTRPGDIPLDEHGVEQVISSLRRKLGEPLRHPRLLLNRRGIGYGLFLCPENAS